MLSPPPPPPGRSWRWLSIARDRRHVLIVHQVVNAGFIGMCMRYQAPCIPHVSLARARSMAVCSCSGVHPDKSSSLPAMRVNPSSARAACLGSMPARVAR